MEKYILWIEKNRKPLLVLFVLTMLLAVAGVFQLNINADFDVFKLIDSTHQEELDEMKVVFGENNQTILMIESDFDDYEQDFANVESVLSKLETEHISPNFILSQFEGSLEDKVAQLGSMSPIIIKEDKVYGTFTLNIDNSYEFALLYDALDVTYYISGNPYMQYEIVSLILNIIMFIPPLALFLILMTFRSQLSSFKAAFLSVLPAGIAALWTLGVAGWFGGELSVITVLAPIFSIVIGSADGLHFISHMEDSTEDKIPTLTHTLKLVGVPMIITTTTSMAGFLGLLLINTQAIKDLALFASLGIFLAGVVTWYVLPLILTGHITLKKKSTKHAQMNIKKLWGKPSYIIVMVLLVSAVFIPSLKSEFNQLLFFKDSTNVQQNFNKIIEINDGALPVYYFGHTTLEKKDDTLDEVSQLLNILESDPNVSKVINPLKIIDTSSFDLSKLSQAKQFIRLVNNDLYYRFVVFPTDFDNETLEALEVSVKDSKLNGQLTGVQFLMKEMNASMISGQFRSILFTFGLIIIMLLIALRSFRLTVIASLPIVITSIILYGFLGLTQISLNVLTATIFSITLGIGVDYAIHFTSIYKYYNDKGDSLAAEHALKYTARPVIANALGLSLGMSALWISPLKIHMHISLLMWVAMMVSVLISLTLIPTLLQKRK